VDEERLFLLTHENQTKGMIEIGICKKDAGDRTIARRSRTGLQFRRALDLPRQIGRGVDQKPAIIVAGDGNARLRLRRYFSGARGAAVCAGTIPLRKAAARRASENPDANRSILARSNRAGVARALEKDRQRF
jgi:hypothetical protein